MAYEFTREEIAFCRLKVTENSVFVVSDQWGNGRGITSLSGGRVREARWLPNGQIEVVFEGGSIYHYYNMLEFYPVRGSTPGGWGD